MAPSEWSWMAEMASEELQKLEAMHPNHFDSLKTELKLLISEPRWDVPLLLVPQQQSTATTTSLAAPAPSAPTQVSSNRKRKCDHSHLDLEEHEKGRHKNGSRREKDRAEMAIERAEKCLKRIRTVKQSFFGFTN